MRLQPLQLLLQILLMAIKATEMATLPKNDTPVTSPETVNARGIGTETAAATATANDETETAAGIDTAAAAALQTRREHPVATQAVIGAVGVEVGVEIAKTDTHAVIEMEIIIVAVGMLVDARARALLEDVSTALEIATNAVITVTVVTKGMTIEIAVAAGLLALIETLEILHLLSSRRMREIAGQFSYNSLPLDSGQRNSKNSLKRLALFPKPKSSRIASATVPKGMCHFLSEPEEVVLTKLTAVLAMWSSRTKIRSMLLSSLLVKNS